MMMEMIRGSSGMVSVPFHEDTIYLVEHEGQPYVPVRPIVENLGLDWKSQHVKLKMAEGRWGVVMITTPSRGGRQQSLCIPVTVEIPTFLPQMFERCASDMTEALGLLTKITGVELRPKQTRR